MQLGAGRAKSLCSLDYDTNDLETWVSLLVQVDVHLLATMLISALQSIHLPIRFVHVFGDFISRRSTRCGVYLTVHLHGVKNAWNIAFTYPYVA